MFYFFIPNIIKELNNFFTYPGKKSRENSIFCLLDPCNRKPPKHTIFLENLQN